MVSAVWDAEDDSKNSIVMYWDTSISKTDLVPWMNSSLELEDVIGQYGDAFIYACGGKIYAAARSNCRITKVISNAAIQHRSWMQSITLQSFNQVVFSHHLHVHVAMMQELLAPLADCTLTESFLTEDYLIVLETAGSTWVSSWTCALSAPSRLCIVTRHVHVHF